MRRQFGKKDVVFIGSLLLLCAIVLLLFRVAFRSEGTKIVITRDGELYGTPFQNPGQFPSGTKMVMLQIHL